jgi:ABC-type antimicrobial peptide transport system permease subunit
MELAQTLRSEITRAAPEIRMVNARTQTELVEQHTLRERLLAMLSVVFAAVALVIAAVGIYGVLNYSVAQRRREIGIRMALGSTIAGIARNVTSNVSRMMLVGAAAGLAAGLLSERYIESLLYAVKPTDPVMVAIPALTIFTAALLAAAPPIRNAARTDPAVTLRVE